MTDNEVKLEIAKSNLKSPGIEVKCDKGRGFTCSDRKYFDVYICNCEKLN
jgi:hypothetical protein